MIEWVSAIEMGSIGWLIFARCDPENLNTAVLNLIKVLKQAKLKTIDMV